MLNLEERGVGTSKRVSRRYDTLVLVWRRVPRVQSKERARGSDSLDMSPIGKYGSVAGGDGDAQDQAERAWYDQPVRRQNPYFLSFTLILFLSLAVAGVTLNATGVVTFGPGQFKPEPLENLAICEVDFCGGGLLFSEDGVPVETQHRGPWVNPLTQAQLSSCSKLRSDAAEDIEVVFIAAFDNPTGTPVQMDGLHVEFQRSGGAELGSCHVLETPTSINPAGNNRVDVDCVFKAAEVGQVVASWWKGEEVEFVTTWGAEVTLTPEAAKLTRWRPREEVGRPSKFPYTFSLPQRPALRSPIDVWVNDPFPLPEMGAAKTSKMGAELTPDGEGAPNASQSATPAPTPRGSHLADFFGSAGGLFPVRDDARGNACSGNTDLTVMAPSLYLCDVVVDLSWASSFGDCLESNDWSSTRCANVASAVRLSATAVVNNPGDLHLKLSRFTVNAWLNGHGDSTGTGEVSDVTHVEIRAKETLRVGVEVPWLGAPEELGAYARGWWDGGSLEMTLTIDVDVETMGMNLHVKVPEFSTAAKSRTVGSDSIADYSFETPASRAEDGECTCLAGECQLTRESVAVGHERGEACLFSTQCISERCGWTFRCE